MTCVKFNLGVMIKNLLKKKCKDPQDYVYMNWQFISAYPKELVGNKFDERVENIDNLPSFAEFENIHKWLQGQDNISSCREIYCDCCDAVDDVHYACVDLTLPNARKDNNDCFLDTSYRKKSDGSSTSSEYDSIEDGTQSEESYYSLQLRKKSKVIFSSS